MAMFRQQSRMSATKAEYNCEAFRETPMRQMFGDSSEPDQPNAELVVRIVVPEEFTGYSIGELQSRGGCVADMQVHSGSVVIRGSLPASEYPALQDAISSATQQRGNVERELRSD
jgi:elongation factor G-like protein